MDTIQLSASGLVRMADLMAARYLDQDYVRLAGSHTQSDDALEAAGLIEEDFFGEVTLCPQANLLSPIFFGLFEAEYYLEVPGSYVHFKIHDSEQGAVRVDIQADQLTISPFEVGMLDHLLPEIKTPPHRLVLDEQTFMDRQPEGIIILKNSHVGGKGKLVEMVYDQGLVYRWRYGKIYSIGRYDLERLCKRILWEERE